jgi:hypothetical protein
MFGWLRTHLDPNADGSPTLGAMSLPWLVTTRAGRIYIAPAEEIRTARNQSQSRELVPGTTVTEIALPNLPAAEVEIATSTVHTLQTVTLLDDRNRESLTIDPRRLSDPAHATNARQSPTPTHTDAEPLRIFSTAALWKPSTTDASEPGANSACKPSPASASDTHRKLQPAPSPRGRSTRQRNRRRKLSERAGPRTR